MAVSTWIEGSFLIYNWETGKKYYRTYTINYDHLILGFKPKNQPLELYDQFYVIFF